MEDLSIQNSDALFIWLSEKQMKTLAYNSIRSNSLKQVESYNLYLETLIFNRFSFLNHMFQDFLKAFGLQGPTGSTQLKGNLVGPGFLGEMFPTTHCSS